MSLDWSGRGGRSHSPQDMMYMCGDDETCKSWTYTLDSSHPLPPALAHHTSSFFGALCSISAADVIIKPNRFWPTRCSTSSRCMYWKARAAATAEAKVRGERERTVAVEAAREREKIATEKVRDELRRFFQLEPPPPNIRVRSSLISMRRVLGGGSDGSPSGRTKVQFSRLFPLCRQARQLAYHFSNSLLPAPTRWLRSAHTLPYTQREDRVDGGEASDERKGSGPRGGRAEGKGGSHQNYSHQQPGLTTMKWC